MEEQYEVLFEGKPVGKVRLQRQGLYLRVICHCIIPDERVLRLYAVWDNGRENLGVVVPDGDGFSLNRKIPAKRLGGGNLTFSLSDGCGQREHHGEFIPICPEEPFFYIDRLKDAFLQRENGKNGIIIPKHPEAV